MSAFGDKFKAERAKQGSGGTFKHNGKSYSTNVAGETGSSGSKNKSIGSKIMGGIKSAGNQIKADFQHATNKDFGTAQSRADYDARTAATRERMANAPPSNRSEGAADQRAAAGAAPVDMTETYAENLKRYQDYMESQGQPVGGPAGGKGGPRTMPQQPEITPEMREAALGMFESQQGAGQVPYYMAAARNANNPNMSPAFQYAAQNYDVLGGSQRLAPRPMEMMSVAERNRVNDMSQAMADQAAQRQMAQNEYQQGLTAGKGGPRTMPQPSMPQQGGGLMGTLAKRFGPMGGSVG
tara:strand:+ start:263 stop:1150 length:888 start_codon:yes stop_codon:yes gene_type:complete